jgi:hypothetical protein
MAPYLFDDKKKPKRKLKTALLLLLQAQSSELFTELKVVSKVFQIFVIQRANKRLGPNIGFGVKCLFIFNPT